MAAALSSRALQSRPAAGGVAPSHRIRVCASHAPSAGSLKAPQQGAWGRCTAASRCSAAVRCSRVLLRPVRATQQEEALCTSSVEGEDVVELEIKVEGMMCGGCSSRVHDALKDMEHVRAVDVSLESHVASIEVQANTMIDALNMMPTFVEAIKGLGFEAQPHMSLHPGDEYV